MAEVEAIVVIQETSPAAVEVPTPVTPAFAELIQQGPPGPPGTGTAPEVFVHEQSSPSDTWVINHNYGHRPIVELYTVGGVAMEGNIIHINNNQAQVLFSSPIAGFATVL